MKDCLEIFGDVIAIHLFEPGVLSFGVPFNVRVPFVETSGVVFNDEAVSVDVLKSVKALAVDSYYNVPEGSIIIEPGATVSESTKQSIAGTCYSTKVSAKTYAIDSLRNFVNSFSEYEYFDVLIVDSSEHIFLLRGSEPSTTITMSAVLPKTSKQGIEIEVISVNGLQLLC